MHPTPPTDLSAAEADVAQRADRAGMVEAIRRMVRIESWNGNETPAQALMVELMTEAGLRRAHRPDEYVEVEELVQMARALAVLAMRFCA